MRHLYALALLSFWLATPALAVPISATWSKGAAPGPVVAYDVLVSRNGGAFVVEKTVTVAPEPMSTVIEAPAGQTLVVQVAPRDAAGVVGPRSDPSDPLTVPALPPGLGKPGKVELRGVLTIEIPIGEPK
jgi:hypothetical protein